MFRTYRRKNSTKNGMCSHLEYFISEWVHKEGFQYRERIEFPKNSKEYQKGKAKFHSDGATTSFKEPGPSWFRNIFSDRPLRQKAKRELHKFIKNEEYEPIIESKGILPYWT